MDYLSRTHDCGRNGACGVFPFCHVHGVRTPRCDACLPLTVRDARNATPTPWERVVALHERACGGCNDTERHSPAIASAYLRGRTDAIMERLAASAAIVATGKTFRDATRTVYGGVAVTRPAAIADDTDAIADDDDADAYDADGAYRYTLCGVDDCTEPSHQASTDYDAWMRRNDDDDDARDGR